MAFANKKIAEGLEYLAKGDKSMKTGLFKWKPDYDEAISMYTKAAVAFKNAKSWEQATASYLKAAEVQKEAGQHFHAAKSMEAASGMYRERGDLTKCADLVEEAVSLYLTHGTPDTALIALERAGKSLEASEADRAIRLYIRGVDIAEGEDNVRQCAEMAGKVARLYIRQKKYEEAIVALRKEMAFYASLEDGGCGQLHKLVLVMVLLQLHRADYVAADKEFKAAFSYRGFGESEEAGPIERLLDAYDQGDEDVVASVVKDPLFRYMENDFTKLARDLRVPGGRPRTTAAAAGDNAAVGAPDGGAQDAAGEEEDDEFAGGLC